MNILKENDNLFEKKENILIIGLVFVGFISVILVFGTRENGFLSGFFKKLKNKFF